MHGDLGLTRASVVVGRDAELDLLRRALHHARAGRATCALLVGEGGIGKTRLVSETAVAAEQLELPRATVTHTIQQLEKRLGVRLLQRTTRHVSTTPDGDAYLQRCVRLLADLQETEDAFGRAAARPSGKLRVDLQGTLATHFLLPHLGEFFARYNPRLHEQDLKCPVLLFHAQDDSNVAVSESTGLAERLKQDLVKAQPAPVERYMRHADRGVVERAAESFFAIAQMLFDDQA